MPSKEEAAEAYYVVDEYIAELQNKSGIYGPSRDVMGARIDLRKFFEAEGVPEDEAEEAYYVVDEYIRELQTKSGIYGASEAVRGARIDLRKFFEGREASKRRHSGNFMDEYDAEVKALIPRLKGFGVVAFEEMTTGAFAGALTWNGRPVASFQQRDDGSMMHFDGFRGDRYYHVEFDKGSQAAARAAWDAVAAEDVDKVLAVLEAAGV